MTQHEPLRALDVCDHATERGPDFIMCEAKGRHSIHFGWYGFPAKRCHRWTDEASACGTRECPDVG